MITRLSDISSVHWQSALHHAGVVEGLADIEQSIAIILSTPKGSHPHRPDFGANVHLYIDHPVAVAIPHLVREAVEAIRRWEPRCTLIKVIPSVEASHTTLRVLWQLDDGVERETRVSL